MFLQSQNSLRNLSIDINTRILYRVDIYKVDFVSGFYGQTLLFRLRISLYTVSQPHTVYCVGVLTFQGSTQRCSIQRDPALHEQAHLNRPQIYLFTLPEDIYFYLYLFYFYLRSRIAEYVKSSLVLHFPTTPSFIGSNLSQGFRSRYIFRNL